LSLWSTTPTGLFSDVGQVGTIAALTPQIFLMDYVGKIRERRVMERLMRLLDKEQE
jgi:hypothetical protein